jgi:hypothetical protein
MPLLIAGAFVVGIVVGRRFPARAPRPTFGKISLYWPKETADARTRG